MKWIWIAIWLSARAALVAEVDPIGFNVPSNAVWTNVEGARYVVNVKGRLDPIRMIGTNRVLVAGDWSLEDAGVRQGGLAGWRSLPVRYSHDTENGLRIFEVTGWDGKRWQKIAVTNFNYDVTRDSVVIAHLKKVGTARVSRSLESPEFGGGTTLELWDYGVPVEPATNALSANPSKGKMQSSDKEKKAAEARFAGVKTRAEGGSTNAMLELAKLYRTGTGTETNDFEARVWEIRAGK